MKKRILSKAILLLFAVISMVFSPVYVKASSNNLYKENVAANILVKSTTYDCHDAVLGCVDDESSLAWLLQKILNYIKILGPTMAISMGTIDFVKVIIISDEENMKKTQTKFIKRIVAAMLLFFIPTIVELLLNIVGLSGYTGGLK